MGIKNAIFADQSSAGRLRRLRTNTTAKKNVKETAGYPVKNTTEKNSVNDALTRVRGGGAVVPRKNRHLVTVPM